MSNKYDVKFTDNGDGTYSVPIESAIPCFTCKYNLDCNGDCFYKGFTFTFISETENREEKKEFSPPELIQMLIEAAEKDEE